MIDEGKIQFAPKANPQKEATLLDLLQLQEGAKAYGEAYFESLNDARVQPTGSLLYHVDKGFKLILNNPIEAHFLKFLASSGIVASIRGQTLEVPYVKPWASTPSPYYPDFVIHLNDGRIAILEVKSILGMCQDENIVKYEYLLSYCRRHGYLAAFFDADLVPFGEYLWPVEEGPVKDYFQNCLTSLGGFNQEMLKRMEAHFPRISDKDLKRAVSSLILQDPYLINRYCHDSPYLINAVKVASPLSYKRFR